MLLVQRSQLGSLTPNQEHSRSLTQRRIMRFVHLIVLCAVAASPLRGQAPAASHSSGGAKGDSLDAGIITPGAYYQKGGLHRALLGGDYRQLWAARISVPVLNLQHYAGGLRAIERGGGKQTTSLHLEAADGRKFSLSLGR
jgi:hypothetical protein